MIDPELLLQGYRLGVFPMAMEDDSIQWFSPDPRAILPLEDFHVPHTLRRLVRKKVFETTIDRAFSTVIEACAKHEDTWINVALRNRHIQNRSGDTGGTFAGEKIRVARYAVAHPALATIWRYRNFSGLLPAHVAQINRIAPQVLNLALSVGR